MHEAALNFVVRGDVEYKFVDDVSADNYDQTLRELSDDGNELILGDAFAHEEVARLISREFPNTAYLMGSSYRPDAEYPNFSVFDSYIQDAAHLSGIIGGSLTKKGRIGVVGRFPSPNINRLINSFIDGTREFRTDIDISVEFQNSWHDTTLASGMTMSLMANGSDVIFADAPGVAQTASRNEVPVIGSFSGMYLNGADTVVTYSRWHVEPTIQAALNQLKQTGVSAQDFGIYSYMRHAGCSLAPIGAFRDQIPEQAIERATLREAEMRSRRFTANLNSARPISGLFRL